MDAELKAQVRDLVKQKRVKQAVALLRAQGDDPDAQKMLTALKAKIEQAKARQSALADDAQPPAPKADNPKDYARFLIESKQYEKAHVLLSRFQNDPEMREMLTTLRGVMDVAQKKDKPRANEYTTRWDSERIASNVTVSLILLLIFRDVGAVVAIVVYWLYDLLLSPAGRLNPFHVGAAIFIAISSAFILRDVLPAVLVATSAP